MCEWGVGLGNPQQFTSPWSSPTLNNLCLFLKHLFTFFICFNFIHIRHVKLLYNWVHLYRNKFTFFISKYSFKHFTYRFCVWNWQDRSDMIVASFSTFLLSIFIFEYLKMYLLGSFTCLDGYIGLKMTGVTLTKDFSIFKLILNV